MVGSGGDGGGMGEWRWDGWMVMGWVDGDGMGGVGGWWWGGWMVVGWVEWVDDGG